MCLAPIISTNGQGEAFCNTKIHPANIMTQLYCLSPCHTTAAHVFATSGHTKLYIHVTAIMIQTAFTVQVLLRRTTTQQLYTLKQFQHVTQVTLIFDYLILVDSILLGLVVANLVHTIEESACQFRYDGPVWNSLCHSIDCSLLSRHQSSLVNDLRRVI